MIQKLLIAESRGFSQAAIAVLKEHFDVKCDDLDRAGLLKRVGEFDVLWVRVRTMIDNEIMNAAPKLKWIATNTTGLNHVDLAAAQKRGIQVVSLQGESDFLRTIRATAEHTIGLTLATDATMRHIETLSHAGKCQYQRCHALVGGDVVVDDADFWNLLSIGDATHFNPNLNGSKLSLER